MSATYYIKAYCTKQGQQQPEIRRFQIDISPDKDAFKELLTKIASFQSDNQLNDFSLQYNDEENERITFSSNDELRAAIALNKDGNTLKVFVTFNQSIPQQQQTQQNDTGNKELHPGVMCDGCNGPVIGFRYKCFVCPNYDLCEKCSSAGVHPEHNMIKITKPGDFQYPHDPHHRPHSPPHPHAHPHPHPHHHGRRQRNMPRPPFIPGADFIEQIQAQIPQWLPNQANAAHFRAHMQQHLNTLKTSTQSQMQNSKEYLENVGKYLQQALSPFGIDCDYRVDEHQTTTTTNTTEQQQQEEQVASTNNQQQEEQVASTNSQQQEEQVTSTNDQQKEEEVISDDMVIVPEPSAVPKYPDLIEIDNTNHEQAASASAPAQPIPDESTKITNPLEKAIDDCMERLMAMGFTDTHGALRDLIRSKQGEINAVLDAINPRHHQA